MTTPRDTRAVTDDPSQAPARKPYHKPELHVYGDLSKITQSVNKNNAPDGGSTPNKHATS